MKRAHGNSMGLGSVFSRPTGLVDNTPLAVVARWAVLLAAPHASAPPRRVGALPLQPLHKLIQTHHGSRRVSPSSVAERARRCLHAGRVARAPQVREPRPHRSELGGAGRVEAVRHAAAGWPRDGGAVQGRPAYHANLSLPPLLLHRSARRRRRWDGRRRSAWHGGCWTEDAGEVPSPQQSRRRFCRGRQRRRLPRDPDMGVRAIAGCGRNPREAGASFSVGSPRGPLGREWNAVPVALSWKSGEHEGSSGVREAAMNGARNHHDDGAYAHGPTEPRPDVHIGGHRP